MRKTALLSLALLFTMGMLLVACSGITNEEGPAGEGEEAAKGETGDTGEAGEGGDLELVYVNWDSEIASTNVIKKVLEDEGFNVTITPVDNAPMWQAVADGSADGMVAAWLPATHKDQFERFGDQVEDLGANLEGAKIGLVVPEYVDINSIEELNDNADKFNGQIVGIEPGAGVMSATETAIEEYGLDNLELLPSSSAGMTAELSAAIEKEEWVVVTGWTPHWKFQKFDLKYLEDPKGVFGEAENIHTMVRKGLKDEMPRAYEILDNFNWTTEDMEAVMLQINEGAEPADAAAEWVENNQDKVKEWVGK